MRIIGNKNTYGTLESAMKAFYLIELLSASLEIIERWPAERSSRISAAQSWSDLPVK